MSHQPALCFRVGFAEIGNLSARTFLVRYDRVSPMPVGCQCKHDVHNVVGQSAPIEANLIERRARTAESWGPGEQRLASYTRRGSAQYQPKSGSPRSGLRCR